MATTIKDIARVVGCSPSTVSRALSDHPQINENTKKAIRVVAKKMNFQINQVAAGLRKHKTNCIGVIVPQISNYFFSSILSGIQKVAAQAQYQVFVCETNESVEQEAGYIKSLSAGRTDGILMSLSKTTDTFDHLNDLNRQHIPLVLFDRTSDKVNVDQVEAEDESGAFMAVDYLLKGGSKRIAYLSGPENLRNSKNRLKGYKAALKKHKLSFKNKLVHVCDFNDADIKEAMTELFANNSNIDAVFAANDIMAVEAIQVLKSMQIAVPDQVAVVGFGDYPIARIVEPKLTTVSHNAHSIGINAAKRLFKAIEGVSLDFKEEKISSELIIRDSTR
ncbi:MAG: LacI family DNA-binding transcriptional regulator [Bacteroidota bacterium]